MRSAVETTSAVVKLSFKLSLCVCETREVEVLESYEQGADSSREHSFVIKVARKECVNEVSVRRVKSLPWRKDVTSSVPLRRCVCRLGLRRSSRGD